MAQILTDTYTYVIFWTKITAVSFVVLGGRCSDVRRSRDSLKQILRHLVNIMDSYYDQYAIKIVLTLILLSLCNITTI